jgi:hypothetical protein
MNLEQNNVLLKRRYYPLFAKLNIKFDIEKVRQELSLLDSLNGWNDMTPHSELVKDLIKGRDRLTEKFKDDDGSYNSYHQILLTEYNSSQLPEANAPQTTDAAKVSTYKQDSKRAVSTLDERNYNKPRTFIEQTPELKNILDHFGSRLMRARFARIAPNFSIKPHIDYDTTYGIRLHLAVESNDKSFIWLRHNKNEDFQKFYVPTDGHLYFVNAGFEHYASNNGTTERTHLVLSIHGQQDIAHLVRESFE